MVDLARVIHLPSPAGNGYPSAQSDEVQKNELGQLVIEEIAHKHNKCTKEYL